MLSFAVTVCVAASSIAQLPQTRIGSVVPPGGQAGTTFEVSLAGDQDLEYELAPQLIFDHAGINAEPVVDAAGSWQGRAFRVTVASDVPAGRYEARLVGFYGASQPRTILIESRPVQTETTDATPAAPATISTDVPALACLETPADVDVFAFNGEQGRTAVVKCIAAALDSPLQPVIEVTAPNGRRIGFAGGAFQGEAILPLALPSHGEYRVSVSDASYRGGADFAYHLEVATRPVVKSIFPPAGVAGQTASLTLYGYNLAGAEPVAGHEPLQRKPFDVPFPGDSHLQPRSALLNPSQAAVSGFDFVFREGDAIADAVPVFFSPQQLISETEPNNETSRSQKLTVPVEIGGSFQSANDVDRFVFDAKQGDVFYVEAFARRYESAADPVIVIDQVAAADGTAVEKQVATADDAADNLAANLFDTLTDDPLVRFEVPSDGSYRVSIRDRYFASRGSPLLTYRLSIRRPSPDFELAAVTFRREKPDAPAGPGAISLRKGANVALSVFAFRRDRFDGPISVSCEGLPAGVTTTGVTIAEGQTATTLILSASADAAAAVAPTTIIGDGQIAGSNGETTNVRRIARTATVIRGGASQSVETRLTSGIVVSVLEESSPYRLVGEGGVIRVGQGSQVLLPVAVERQPGFVEPVTCAVDGLPKDAKVAIETKPFVPELVSQQVRLLIDASAPPRSYELALHGNAKIDVSRFPLRLKKAKTAQEAAAKAFAQADESHKQATAARDQAISTLQAAEAVAGSASAALMEQTKAAVAASKTAVEALEAAIKTADDLRKQAEAAKAAADQAAGEAEKVSAPQKIDDSSPAPAVALTIVPAPATFSAEVPENGQIKKGGSIAVKVTVKRQKDFAGPITLSLAVPPGVVGLTAETVTIAADQNEAALRLSASPDATEGEVIYPAIRTMAEQNGSVQVDVPIALTVTQ